MGGSASVQKDNAAPKALSGSASKYEDKNTDTGSKATAKSDDKQETPLVSTPDPSQVADKKTTTISMTADAKNVQTSTSENVVVFDRNTAEELPNQQDDERPVNNQLERNDYSASQIALFSVGDFVQIPNPDGTMSEGLVLEIVDSEKVVLDICAEGIVRTALAADCELIVKSDVMEIGDQVQVQPQGSAMFFVGRLSQINADGTFDVVMEGDDPDDIETSVPASNIRKLMSRRAIVVARWKRAAMVVSSIHNFQSFVVDPSMFSASVRATKESAKIVEDPSGEGE